jgi:hypothetical protein
LACWPRGDEAWLALTISQGSARIEVQSQAVWSSVPERTPFLMSDALSLGAEDFMALWRALTWYQSAQGVALPSLAVGRWPAGARQPPDMGTPVDDANKAWSLVREVNRAKRHAYATVSV